MATTALAVWTLFVWVGRVRNILGDEALVGGARIGRLALAVSFVVPAALLLLLMLWARAKSARAAAETGTGSETVALAVVAVAVALAAWTVPVWLVRGLDIVVDQQHDGAFRAVHSALALVSIALAIWVARSWMEKRLVGS